MAKFWITKAGAYFETSDDLAKVAGASAVEQRPNPDCDMVGGKWVQRAPDLAAVRAGASIEKSAFCMGLARLGVVPRAEAISASRGEWPQSMAAFLAFLDEDQQLDAQVDWATCATVRRMHPFVLSLASWIGLTDAQVDALFGIAP